MPPGSTGNFSCLASGGVASIYALVDEWLLSRSWTQYRTATIRAQSRYRARLFWGGNYDHSISPSIPWLADVHEAVGAV